MTQVYKLEKYLPNLKVHDMKDDKRLQQIIKHHLIIFCTIQIYSVEFNYEQIILQLNIAFNPVP